MRLEADPLKSRSRSHREDIRKIRMSAQMVFQEFNLFPHMHVIDNLIEAPIRVRGLKKDEAIATAEKYLARVGLRRNAMRTRRGCPAARSSGWRSPGR